jgi:hypothetical protein
MTEAPVAALTAERLFEQVFWPLYPEDVRADLTRARTTDANPAGNPRLLESFDEIARTFVRMAPSVFSGDELALDQSDASVHRLSAALTRPRRDAWMRERGPDGAPLLAHVVVHGAIYVASCAVLVHGGEWRVRRPLWESLVRLVSAAGEADLAVFQWWLKSLSDAEIDRDTLADRYRAHVEQPRFDAHVLPVIPRAGRAAAAIPRLAKVRYDTLFKHLKAHVPELRELGEHFPSATRFAELAFAHLEFMWLGDGRMLLIHGQGAQGVHLFWLDHNGFRQAAFYPADASVYRVSCTGDVLRIELQQGGRTQEHEMLWWGV